MQKQIASYLFQQKNCPLPGIGTLSISNTSAEIDFTNKLFGAPKSNIQFQKTETNAAGLLDYLSASTGDDENKAAQALNHFCNGLKQKVISKQTVTLNNIGSFSADASGNINFTQQQLPTAFAQAVFAERVIHPDAEHAILVGDKETTNTVMTELLSPSEEKEISRWWIWAIVLFAISLIAMLIYFTEFDGAAPFGNAIKI